MTKKAIILLSGGLDSATCLAYAKNKGFDLYALSFDYGQRHKFELESAKNVAECFNVIEHKIINIDLRTFGASALTDDIEVPDADKENMGKDIPVTYVPARNTIFLSYALAYAEVRNCFNIFIGVNNVDYSGYPDCRPEYIEAYKKMANLATKSGIEGKKLSIHTPLLNLNKSEIIKLGINLGVDYSITHTCYNPNEQGNSCGKCESCVYRLKGFKEAGIKDPVKYSF
jgi:7-cyano-7-deazaguanine synthase